MVLFSFYPLILELLWGLLVRYHSGPVYMGFADCVHLLCYEISFHIWTAFATRWKQDSLTVTDEVIRLCSLFADMSF